MPKRHEVAVYGTLMAGERNERWAADALDRRPCTLRGTLYDTGRGYPAFVPDEAGCEVKAELLTVTYATLALLDGLEGFPWLYGHRKVYLVIGRNKLAEDYDSALWRARNVAAPKNAQRLNCKTPCAVKGDRCYDCKSPDRICCGLVVLWRPMMGQDIEIILVDEDLGY